MSEASRNRLLSRRWRAHAKQAVNVAPDVTIGMAGSFTLDSLMEYVGGQLLDAGMGNPKLVAADYNQLMTVCQDPEGAFRGAQPNVIVILWRLEDLADATKPQLVQAALEMLLAGVRTLRARFAGTIVLGLPPRPRSPFEGVAQFSRPSLLQSLWYQALSAVAVLASELADTHTVDIEAELARIGNFAGLDSRKDYLYRQPYSEALLFGLAEQIVRICLARTAAARKCIVVDCDNTLWGGIIGEDGVGGIELSDDYPGRPFRDFQRQLKALRDTGIFLALCSKNNPADVEEVFASHSAMVLSWDDVSVAKINWQPKSDNIREIAAELNIGLDAIVFIDDNAFEIEEVRTHLPEVLCLQLPEELADIPASFQSFCRAFDRLDLTEDDHRRVDMQRAEVQRKDLHQKLTDGEFLQSLDLVVDIREPAAADYARITQLINKTNQFNVTTRRYGLEDVAGMVQDRRTHVYCASVSDRFGDYGLVGVAIVRDDGNAAVFDTFLMSCRVLGRGVETALLAYGVECAASRGVHFVVGQYLPTRKNGMVEHLFTRHGFDKDEASSDQNQIFVRETYPIQIPPYLTVRRPLAATASAETSETAA